jgi:hypothetical protein
MYEKIFRILTCKHTFEILYNTRLLADLPSLEHLDSSSTPIFIFPKFCGVMRKRLHSSIADTLLDCTSYLVCETVKALFVTGLFCCLPTKNWVRLGGLHLSNGMKPPSSLGPHVPPKLFVISLSCCRRKQMSTDSDVLRRKKINGTYLRTH